MSNLHDYIFSFAAVAPDLCIPKLMPICHPLLLGISTALYSPIIGYQVMPGSGGAWIMEPKQIGQTAALKMAYTVGEDSYWTLFSQQRKHNFSFAKNLPLQVSDKIPEPNYRKCGANRDPTYLHHSREQNILAFYLEGSQTQRTNETFQTTL